MEDVPVFWEKTPPACRCWVLLRIRKKINKNLDEPGRDSTGPAEQFEGKCLRETKNSGFSCNEREIAFEFFSRIGKIAITPRAKKNTLGKMKFSFQKSNAEYIIYFWAKSFQIGSAKFRPEYHNWNLRVQKTILEKFFSGRWCTFVTKVLRKFWLARKIPGSPWRLFTCPVEHFGEQILRRNQNCLIFGHLAKNDLLLANRFRQSCQNNFHVSRETFWEKGTFLEKIWIFEFFLIFVNELP